MAFMVASSRTYSPAYVRARVGIFVALRCIPLFNSWLDVSVFVCCVPGRPRACRRRNGGADVGKAPPRPRVIVVERSGKYLLWLQVRNSTGRGYKGTAASFRPVFPTTSIHRFGLLGCHFRILILELGFRGEMKASATCNGWRRAGSLDVTQQAILLRKTE
jgi:hypothetical protein